ncbi:MAG: HlyD family secretion protein [Pseudomonadota bacterium]
MFGRRLLGLLIAILLALFFGNEFSRRYFSYTADAYVLSDVAVVSPAVAGHLVALNVEIDTHVCVGDLLFTIDPRPYELDLEVAEANVAVAQGTLQSLVDGLTEAEARVNSAQAQVDDVQITQERLTALLADGTVPQQRVDDINAALAEAQGDLEVAQAAQVVAEDDVAEQRARVASATASRAVAEYNLSQTQVYAPASGRIAPFMTRVGDYFDVGEAVVAIVTDDAFRVVANLPEQHLARLEVGQTTWLMLASQPWKLIRGHVMRIPSGVTRSKDFMEQAVFPFVSPQADWIRLSSRFPVEIAIDRDQDLPTLYLGADARALILRDADGEGIGQPTTPDLALDVSGLCDEEPVRLEAAQP